MLKKYLYVLEFFFLCHLFLYTAGATESKVFIYDDAQRLVGVIAVDGSVVVYDFDEAGNRLQLSISPAQANSVSALIPRKVAAGTTISITVAGRNLASVTGIIFSDPGIDATISGSPSDTLIPVSLSVAATVHPGAYTFSLLRSSGGPIVSGAVVLIVTGVPTLTGLTPGEALQGQTIQTWNLTGTQLSGATGVLFDTIGLTASNLTASPDGTSLTARLAVDRAALIATTGVRVQTPAGISNRAHLQIKPGHQFIQYGETVAGSIDSRGTSVVYAFDGTNGDKVLARMAHTSIFLNPKLRVLRPDGTLLCSGQAVSFIEVQCTLDVTGTYALFAEDDNGLDTGTYALHLQRLTNPGNTTPINFGDTLTGSISASSEIGAYTFSGTTGNIVLARMAHTSTFLNPKLRIFRPDGTLLCGGQAISFTEVQCTLDVTGTYALFAEDDNGLDTGTYGLHLQRVTNPGNTTPINFGDTLTGTITLSSEIDAYTFNGSAGNIVLARMAHTSTFLNPKLRVFRPDGTLLCSGQAISFIEVQCTLDVTGTYALFAEDDNGLDTGTYALHLQRVTNPGNTTPINFGDTLTGSISASSEIDAYNFSGSVGNIVLARMAHTSTFLNPKLRIFRPDGTLLCGGQAISFTEVQCTLDVTGTYALFAEDDNGLDTGTYGLHLQRVTNPGNTTPINFGDTLTGTITLSSEIDAYTFNGSAGNIVLARMAHTSTFLNPKLRVFRPDGTLLCSGQAISFIEVQCTLDITGTYALFAEDDNGLDTGTYALHLQRVTNPGNTTPINFGDTLSGSITSVAELDAYTFSGTAGNQARVTMTRTSGSLAPQIRVYRPDGTQLCAGTPQTLCALDATGTYSILAGDQAGPGTGNYTLSLQPN